MTKPMIPLSVINAKIAVIENDLKQEEKLGQYESKTIHAQLVGMFMILQDLKKEAIPSSLSDGCQYPQEPCICEWHSQENVDNWIQNGITKCPYCGNSIRIKKGGLEQKINARIAELQDEMKAFNKNGKTLHVIELQFGIDELRKLL